MTTRLVGIILVLAFEGTEFEIKAGDGRGVECDVCGGGEGAE